MEQPLAQLKAQRGLLAELMGLVAIITGGIGMCLGQDSVVLFAIVLAMRAHTMAVT